MNPVSDKETRLKQYEAMMDSLEVDDLEPLVHQPLHTNPGIYFWLKSFTKSVSFVKLSNEIRQKRNQQTMFVFAMIIDVLIRLLDEKIWCFTTIVMTLYAVRCGMPTRYWELLTRCKVLYSKRIGQEVATDLGRKVKSIWPAWASTTVGIAVFDNCAYSIRSNHEHVDPSRRNLFYQTVNWFYSFVSNEFDPAINAGGALNKPTQYASSLPHCYHVPQLPSSRPLDFDSRRPCCRKTFNRF